MKKIAIISSTVLLLIIGVTATVYAQDDKRDKQDQHNQRQNNNDQARPEQQRGQQQQKQNQDRQQQQAQQQRQNQDRQQEQRIQQQQEQDRQQQQGQRQQQRQDESRRQDQRSQQQQYQDRQKQGRREQRPQRSQEQQRVWQSTWQNHRAGRWQSDHRSWQQRGGYNGYRIPDDRYRGYFGPQHGFRIYGLPFMVSSGYPRFQYQGYWITLLDPWPEYWSNDWYDNDDVFIDYRHDGYYMYNRRYPQVGIAINISM